MQNITRKNLPSESISRTGSSRAPSRGLQARQPALQKGRKARVC